MDIEHLGSAVVEQLVARGLARDPADLYKLNTDQLLELDKFAEKSARNLLQALNSSKSRALWQLLHGLGIPHVGKQSAKDLEASFDSLESLAAASEAQLVTIDGIGSIMAQSIRTPGLPNPHTASLSSACVSTASISTPPAIAATGPPHSVVRPSS